MNVKLSLGGSSQGLHSHLLGVVMLGVNSQDVLIVCAPQEVLHIRADETFVLEDLLLSLLANNTKRAILLGAICIDIEFKDVEPWTERHDLESFVIEGGLQAFQLLSLMVVVIDHVPEFRLHRFNRKQVHALLHFSNMLQTVFTTVLRFVDFVFGYGSRVKVIYSPSYFILHLSGIQRKTITEVKWHDHVVEDIVNLHLPRLAIISWRIRRIWQECQSPSLLLEISNLPNADHLTFREEGDAGSEWPWAYKFK